MEGLRFLPFDAGEAKDFSSLPYEKQREMQEEMDEFWKEGERLAERLTDIFREVVRPAEMAGLATGEISLEQFLDEITEKVKATTRIDQAVANSMKSVRQAGELVRAAQKVGYEDWKGA